jgi:adenylosuccinate lyase
MAKRLTKTVKKLQVDSANLAKNLDKAKGGIIAEPLQIILSALGHPDAHEKVRQLTLLADDECRELQFVIGEDEEIKEYWQRMTPSQRQVLVIPKSYCGIAPAKAKKVAENWKQKLGL